MKIRNGFVSNSSTSSFIVKRWKDGADTKTLKHMKSLSKKQEKLLKEFGFWFDVETDPKKNKWFNKDEAFAVLQNHEDEELHWAYVIMCNQDDVIEFLFDNKISFKGSLHYDETQIEYNAKEDEIVLTGEDYRNYDKADGPLILSTKTYRKEYM